MTGPTITSRLGNIIRTGAPLVALPTAGVYTIILKIYFENEYVRLSFVVWCVVSDGSLDQSAIFDEDRRSVLYNAQKEFV
jgi:hypothetical protein